jgi:segregation and condensation protein B
MEPVQAKRIVEALLFVSSQPFTFKRLSEVLPDLPPAQIRETVQTLNAEYAATGRAFQVQEVAGGFQLVTDKALAAWVKQALQAAKPDVVSTAALETLAIVAYRQPVTKAEIEAVRGVDVGAALDTLLERKFVRVAGRKESPGRPFLYGTTTEFLRHFGLKSVEALPPMAAPVVPETVTVHDLKAPAPAAGGAAAPAATPATASNT